MPIQDGGISLRIVNFLGKYPYAIPIDFLAKELGRRSEDLMTDLSSLQSRGVVKINQEQQTVAVVETKPAKLSAFFHWLSGTA